MQCQQHEFDFTVRGWGGARKGAGRKKSENSGVSHLKREELTGSDPVHVTMKRKAGLPSFRKKEPYVVLVEAFEAAQKESFRIVHFSVQGDHIHLLVEADGRKELTKGMIGLAVRLSRGLNRLWKRKGTVFADRYHSQVLRSPTEVRNTLRYVLNNVFKHRPSRPLGRPDPFSSWVVFDGWKEHDSSKVEVVGVQPVVPPSSWLLRDGWRRAGGPLSFYERPGGKPRRRRRAGG